MHKRRVLHAESRSACWMDHRRVKRFIENKESKLHSHGEGIREVVYPISRNLHEKKKKSHRDFGWKGNPFTSKSLLQVIRSILMQNDREKWSGVHTVIRWAFANFTRALKKKIMNIFPRSWTSHGNYFDQVVGSVAVQEVNKKRLRCKSMANFGDEVSTSHFPFLCLHGRYPRSFTIPVCEMITDFE